MDKMTAEEWHKIAMDFADLLDKANEARDRLMEECARAQRIAQDAFSMLRNHMEECYPKKAEFKDPVEEARRDN